MEDILYKTKCPNCGKQNCYNSGFTIECVNKQCKFYSAKQEEHIQAELKIKFQTRNTIQDLKQTEQQEQNNQLNLSYADDDELDDYLASSYFPWANHNPNPPMKK